MIFCDLIRVIFEPKMTEPTHLRQKVDDPSVMEQKQKQQQLPWYRSGGMAVNSVGMGFNIGVPVILLVSYLREQDKHNFCGLLLLSYAASILTGRTTLYCIVVVPTFMSSLTLLATLEDSYLGTTIGEGAGIDAMIPPRYSSVLYMAITLVAAVALAITKVNISMSVCLHRYASHAAFKCGPLTHLGMVILGCLANQGGPIWWASQHRCHHKNCDVPRDPHSPLVSGTEKAFGFFQVHQTVVEEFAPPHLESVLMRIIDTWSFVFVALEMAMAYYWFGRTGLFVSYTSGWLCQTMTLWFNIANHPVPPKFVSSTDGTPVASNDNNNSRSAAFNAQCNASNGGGVDPWNDPCLKGIVYLPFVVLNTLTPLFATFVMEAEHAHHHDHPSLAQRSPHDCAYWGFLYPLEQVGLIWNVVVPAKSMQGGKKVL